jgi:hypothetical protein
MKTKQKLLLLLNTLILIVCFFIAPRTNYAEIKNADCDWIEPKDMRIKFCLDRRILGDYKTDYFDRRFADVNRDNAISFTVKASDYSQEIPPPGAYWKRTKINSGILVFLSAGFDPRFKTFKELSDYYVAGFTEPHGEFRPKKATIGRIGDLDYVFDYFTYKEGSWVEVETHFLHKNVQYDLIIIASLKTISEREFLKLHEKLLKSISFLR